ncbi:hypothetical protein HPB52_024217 [Rhipicephalus sanguineus]|uniref:Uncharacterized protein n=1 Tax=Rhipicephalus sanguineus TaxID=34632 RepID=A0A9D4TCN8_RHISA|nr:hypothetical protein HPB52_024217 [Rhipicephalus sanguineus]
MHSVWRLRSRRRNSLPRHLHMPCTKVGDSDCQLLLYLRSTKELLLGASLELVEDQRRPGGLRLAVVQAPASPCPLPCSLDKRRKEVALHYAEHLLSEHRCITAVEINGSTEQPQSLLAALGRNLAVKSVTVRLAVDQIDEANVRVLEVVNGLSHLEELKFAPVSCNCAIALRRRHLPGRQLMERRTEHLHSLDVSVLRLSSESVRRLVWALIWNRTITDLAVQSAYLAPTFTATCREDRTIRQSGHTEHHLTLLGLPSAVCRRCRSPTSRISIADLGVEEIEPWLTALRKTSSLQYLKMDFGTFGQEAFEAFLMEVAKSDNLRSVVLTTHPQNSTRRNASRVSAAARFVLGERDTGEAALGIEHSTTTPHLLELVRDGALVDTDEAKAMIWNARKKLQKYSLDKFMRYAGVVFQSVECHPQHDGRPQLSDIGEDCWSLICSYLSLADIAETAGTPGPYS